MKHHDHADHDHDHSEHEHDHHAPDEKTIHSRVFKWGIGLNLIYVFIEIAYGFQLNSLSLLADAVHNFGDVCGLLLAWLGFVLLAKKPTPTLTFGLKQFSILAAFLNSLFLVLSTLWILKEAYERLYSTSVIPGLTMAVVAGIGVVINFTTALLFRKASLNDLNMRAAFQHLMADAAVSAGVILAGILIYFKGPTWIDPLTSIVISVIVMLTTWSLLKESFFLILGGVPKKVDPVEVKKFLETRPGISEIHSLHIWAISTSEVMMSVHLVMPDGHPQDQFIAELRHHMAHDFSIHSSTFQIEVKAQNCT